MAEGERFTDTRGQIMDTRGRTADGGRSTDTRGQTVDISS
jgi:hypothetical protein